MGGFALAFREEGRGQQELSVTYNANQTPLHRIHNINRICTVYEKHSIHTTTQYMQCTLYIVQYTVYGEDNES